MKSVNSKVYTKDYYLNVCLGSDEFKKNKGQSIHPKLVKLLTELPITADSKVLDLGCGRGDITLFLAKRAALAVGVDYASAAIELAKEIKTKADKALQTKLRFAKMDVKKLDFSDNYFDFVICIDVIEHLYKDEAEIAMQEISRVLKKDGILFVHTGPNKILYDYVYPYYILPINKLVTWLDQKMKGQKYEALAKDPRTNEEKVQHVNEPTYFYIKKLLERHSFTGKINVEVGFLKQITGRRSRVYNTVTLLYPLSKFYPLSLLFAWSFSGSFKKKNSAH